MRLKKYKLNNYQTQFTQPKLCMQGSVCNVSSELVLCLLVSSHPAQDKELYQYIKSYYLVTSFFGIANIFGNFFFWHIKQVTVEFSNVTIKLPFFVI